MNTPFSGSGVWICIPTYNERENVAALVAAVRETLTQAVIPHHVLVIDDDSPDGTGQIVDAIAAHDDHVHILHRSVREGIGPAYIAGFRHALGQGADLVMEMDCDFSHPPDALPDLITASGQADLVVGSRYTRGGRVIDWGLLRRGISRGGCMYAQLLLGLRVRDLTGGFKCFHRRVLETIALDEVSGRGYGFQIEMTYRTILAGFTVVEVPITFTDRRAGSSKMSGSIVTEAALLVPRLRWRLRAKRAGR